LTGLLYYRARGANCDRCLRNVIENGWARQQTPLEADTVDAAVRRLLRRDIVWAPHTVAEGHRGRYRWRVELFKRWIQKNQEVSALIRAAVTSSGTAPRCPYNLAGDFHPPAGPRRLYRADTLSHIGPVRP